jgi:glycosidase
MILRLTKYLLVIFCFLWLSNCNKPFTTPKDSIIQGLASPIILENDTTQIILSDYFDIPFDIDSFSMSNEVISEVNDDILKIIASDATPILSNYIIFVNGLPYSIPLFNRINVDASFDWYNEKRPSIETIEFNKNQIKIAKENTTQILAYWENFRMVVEENENHFYIKIPPYAKYFARSHLRVFCSNDKHLGNDILIPLAKNKIITTTKKLNNNDWHSSIMYKILVERFNQKPFDNSDKNQDTLSISKYEVGTFSSLSEKIDQGYFTKLGINTIFISTEKKSKSLKNWAILNPKLGTEEDLRNLIYTAHKNGMSIILDYKISPNAIDKKSIDDAIDSTIHWIKNFEFDGFIYNHKSNGQYKYWRTLTEQVKQFNTQKSKKHIQLSDNLAQDKNLTGSGLLDGQIDYDTYKTLTSCITKENHSFEDLAIGIEKTLIINGYHHLMGNISGIQFAPRFTNFFLKNYESSSNLKTKETALKALMMLHVFNLTMPGIPIIYYGDDIGITESSDFKHTIPNTLMRFNNLNNLEKNILKELTNLIQLRSNSMALNYGEFRIIEASPLLFKYQRTYFGEKIIVSLDKANLDYSLEHIKN